MASEAKDVESLMFVCREVQKLVAKTAAMTGLQPDRVYLGRSQMAILHRIPLRFTVGVCEAAPKFMGLSLYEVNDDSHFGVGLDAQEAREGS